MIQAALSKAKSRPRVRGKFICVGEEQWYARGVTYGPFHPEAEGSEYHTLERVERDFAQMKAHNINAIRTYTVPPPWLLDAAQRYGLFVMVGLPWEQHITFLDDRRCVRTIEGRVREGIRACAGHPAVLCYAIGNEIPAPIVRWHGHHRIERFLKRLYHAAKEEDPDSLATYVNFPTTEYLQLPFIDLVCFNVFLESQYTFESYLARLQNLAGDRPLIMAEMGLDSRRKGRDMQACTLDWQIRAALAAGCAGVFMFSWTDEWYRGGHEIEDWDFGLTDRSRTSKPALSAVRDAFTQVPFPDEWTWPRISVIICSYNGSATLREGLEALQQVEYPNFEVIIVNDGSTDATASVTLEYKVKLISTENRGLGAARNTGMKAATGELIAYLDDDAYPDPHWLTYLAATFLSTTHVAVGGPNISPPGDGFVAQCIDHAPGNPIHVLLSDSEAEHLPGCNIAFRKTALEAIGGFDPQFRIAGDDVDVCWRLQQRGWSLGFNPAAIVWHHRRGTVRAYWEQQRNYGKAEALLEVKWPEKYNVLGHVPWKGQVYDKSPARPFLFQRWKIYYGVWGSALFQSIYAPTQNVLQSLLLMPEWYLVIFGLCVLSFLGRFWHPLSISVPVLAIALGMPLVQAGLHASQATFRYKRGSPLNKLRFAAVTTLLYLFQPLARLTGRLQHGLTPWRWRNMRGFTFPRKHTCAVWSEQWRAPEQWLASIEASLHRQAAAVLSGGDYDRWDLEVRGGIFGSIRMHMAIEEHGKGKQLARFRLWPKSSAAVLLLFILLTGLCLGAALDRAWLVSASLGALSLLLVLRTSLEWSVALGAILQVLRTCNTQGR